MDGAKLDDQGSQQEAEQSAKVVADGSTGSGTGRGNDETAPPHDHSSALPEPVVGGGHSQETKPR